MPCPIGFTLQPERAYLDRVAPLLDLVDYFEIAPETTWYERPDGTLGPNGYRDLFLELGALEGKPFVAHGVGLSIGSVSPQDEPRRTKWRQRIAEDHAAFDFQWYTDHLGPTSLGGQSLILPLPLLMTDEAAVCVRQQLSQMQQIVGCVGFENSAHTFTLASLEEETDFLRDALLGEDHYLLLDLHNLVVTADNVGFDPEAWLSRIDFDAVIEIHIAGGSESDPKWMASGRTFRLDGHDAAIPESVWALLEDVAPRCTNLRGITLERMEGTVASADVRPLYEEVVRLRALAQGLP